MQSPLDNFPKNNMNEVIITTVAYFYIRERKLLYVRQHGKQAFMMPGGKIDAGEDEVSALIRELKEELSIDLIPKTIKRYGVINGPAHYKPEGTKIHMTCFFGEHIGELLPSREIAEYRFFTLDEYDKMDDKAVLGYMINSELKAKGLID